MKKSVLDDLKVLGFTSLDGFKYFLSLCIDRYGDVDVSTRECIEKHVESDELYKPINEQDKDYAYEFSHKVDDFCTKYYYLF